MVTVGGTVALVGSLAERVTTSESVVSVFRMTVAVAVAPFSTVDTPKLKDRAGPSASFKSRLVSAEP